MRLLATVLLCLCLEMWPESPPSPGRVCSRNGCQVVFHLSWGESFEAGLVADPHLNVLLCHLTLKTLLKHKDRGVYMANNKRGNSVTVKIDSTPQGFL